MTARALRLSRLPVLLLLAGGGCERPAPPSSPAAAPAPAAPAAAATEPVASAAAPAAAPPVAPIHLTDVTEGSGLELVLRSGAEVPSQILEVKGGGLALLDCDGDGDRDLLVPNGATLDAPRAGAGARLFRNDGDLRFTPVADAAGIDFAGWGMGAAVGDLDGDGREDVVITAWGPNALYRSRGAARFENATDAAGIAGAEGAWSTAAALGDLDGDGDLDLVIINYLAFDPARPPAPSRFRGVPVLAGPQGLAPQRDVVYENLGDGTFRDVTEAWGFTAPAAYGLGAVIADFDLDGDLDLYVGNDSMPSYFYRNEGSRSGFVECGERLGIATNGDGAPQATMGLAIADVNDDGWPDLFSTNFASDTNTLHVSVEGRFYDDETRRRGLGMVSYPFVGWACAFCDLDHDGDEDLLLVNGHTYPQATMETMNSAYRQVPLLFVREGDRFRREADPRVAGDWVAAAHVDRSAVFGDLDGDGDVDAVIAERGGPLRLLRNDCPGPPGLIIDIEPPARRAGAQIVVEADGAVQRRWIVSGTGFLSASDPSVHLALPPGIGPVTVHVRFPGGASAVLEGAPRSGRVTVTAPGVPRP